MKLAKFLLFAPQPLVVNFFPALSQFQSSGIKAEVVVSGQLILSAQRIPCRQDASAHPPPAGQGFSDAMKELGSEPRGGRARPCQTILETVHSVYCSST